jgi:radical SAM protein with 4Fe4S-binding SPASM domain
MGNGTVAKKGHILLVRGPINTALYDLENGKVYSVNPLMAELIEGWLGKDQSCKSPPVKEDTLKVLRSYLARHPALGGISDSWSSNKELLKENIQTLSYQSGPVGLDYVWLELTKSCNLFCVHCYEEAGTNLPHPTHAIGRPTSGDPLPSMEKEHISLEQWKGILAEGARLGAKRVQFTGGEPTLYPGLMELIEYARSCRYHDIEVFTNATQLEDSRLRQWATSGVRVALSFYSCDPRTHDTITGKTGSFCQTVQGIRAILAHNIPVRVAIVLMRDNLSHLKDTVEFLKELGLKDNEIEWDYVRPTGRGEAEVAIMGEDVGTEVTPFRPSSREEGQGTCDKGFARGTCWKGKIAISSEGDVYPCIFARQMSIGKFPEMGLEEIIQRQDLQRLWQITLEEVETCRDCELRYGCFDCRALAQTNTGDLLSKNPHCRYNPYTGLMERNGGQKMKERPKKRGDIVSGDVDDETVIYDSRNHNVHHLNLLGSVIWDLCDGNHTVKDITKEIVDVLKADPIQVEGDVAKMVEEFQGKGLLEEASK